jgi:hypothetical protein
MPSTDQSESGGVPFRSLIRVLLVPAIGVAVYLIADKVDGGSSVLASLSAGTRRALFISISATTGALLGFAITGVTILLTVGRGPRIAWLKGHSEFRQETRFLFFSTILALGLATITFLVLIAVGSGKDFKEIWGLIAAALVFLVLDRLWRLVIFLNKLMRVALEDADADSLPNPPFSEPLDDK